MRKDVNGMELHASGEDYLEAILIIGRKKGDVRSIDRPRRVRKNNAQVGT